MNHVATATTIGPPQSKIDRNVSMFTFYHECADILSGGKSLIGLFACRNRAWPKNIMQSAAATGGLVSELAVCANMRALSCAKSASFPGRTSALHLHPPP